MATNYSTSELFTLANMIRKSMNVSQKEAFAMAKNQLEARVNTGNNNISLNEQLQKLMKKGNVKFTFRNHRGKEITTTGTMQMDRVPTNRKVEGRKTAKNENMAVFYDVRHGVYRQYNVNSIVSISSKK